MDLDNLSVCSTILFVVSVIGANIGSMSSIKWEWHAQSIYHKCIMPSVMAVCFLPGMAGWGFGFGLHYSISRLLLAPALVGLIFGALSTVLVSFMWARRRGSRIYAENVRRAAA
jgi:hypothetical protein